MWQPYNILSPHTHTTERLDRGAWGRLYSYASGSGTDPPEKRAAAKSLHLLISAGAHTGASSERLPHFVALQDGMTWQARVLALDVPGSFLGVGPVKKISAQARTAL